VDRLAHGILGHWMSARHAVVLVGGGHTHVQVIRAWAAAPPAGARLTVVTDRPTAVYSGMVPGFVAGQYPREALQIDVEGLARRAGARFVMGSATGLDPSGRRVLLDGDSPEPYDTLSLDVGSAVDGLDTPGVREHAVLTRPIAGFVEALGSVLAAGARGPGRRLVVVGGGAAGVELAFAFGRRLRAEGAAAAVELLEAGASILAGYPGAAIRRVLDRARERGIAVRSGARVVRALPGAVELATGIRLPCDRLIWVGGAAPVPLLARAGLDRDARGFLRVDTTLQCVGRPEVFASGDCASLDDAPWLPKAGVYAVRQGPVLDTNLRARIAGRSLVRYRPQRDFLSLLNLGDGRAVGAKWGVAVEGRWVFRLKDWIDRRFVDGFRDRAGAR
jgi:selenide,water dikinase